MLLQNNGSAIMRSVTGPRYGRIWNADVVKAMADRFGDGVSGDWRVPGEFGKRIEVTKANTTMFAGDRWQDTRVAIERKAGELLKSAA